METYKLSSFNNFVEDGYPSLYFMISRSVVLWCLAMWFTFMYVCIVKSIAIKKKKRLLFMSFDPITFPTIRNTIQNRNLGDYKIHGLNSV